MSDPLFSGGRCDVSGMASMQGEKLQKQLQELGIHVNEAQLGGLSGYMSGIWTRGCQHGSGVYDDQDWIEAEKEDKKYSSYKNGQSQEDYTPLLLLGIGAVALIFILK